MERAPFDRRLIFLVGAPRSGTTWLQLLLSATPEIATVNETQLFSVYTRSLFLGWQQNADLLRKHGFHDFLSPDEWLAATRGFIEVLFSKMLERKPTATIVLEKTPAHVRYWREILSIFPDAHFIHLIRDPRAVVASLIAANRTWAKDWASPRTLDNCATWIDDVTAGREIAKATPNYLEVRYEDLIRNGPETLHSTLTWCGPHVSRG